MRAGRSTPPIDTLLAGQGVCRDYAHLTITLLRALEVPARLVAVYAPGLSPMDFHAVVEADIDGTLVRRRLDPAGADQLAGADLLGPRRRRHRVPDLSAGSPHSETMTVTATTAGPLPAPDDAPFPLP